MTYRRVLVHTWQQAHFSARGSVYLLWKQITISLIINYIIIMLKLFSPPEFQLVESCSCKGIVHPKMKILSLFTHHVVPSLYEFICSVEDILKNAGNLSVGEKYNGSQCLPSTVWLPTLFKISYFKIIFYLSHTRLYREYITSSEMYSLHLTHPKWTHTRSSGQPCYSARGAVGGSVPCSRTPQSWYWRRILPPPTIPAGPEIRTHNLPVTSPTL